MASDDSKVGKLLVSCEQIICSAVTARGGKGTKLFWRWCVFPLQPEPFRALMGLNTDIRFNILSACDCVCQNCALQLFVQWFKQNAY